MSKRLPPRHIPSYGKSYALLSGAKVADTAVIFVHGFGGGPTGTWTNFQGLVDQSPTEWWETSDLFFYDYDSIKTPIRRNANLLGNFVEDVWHGSLLKIALANDDLKYKHLVLVGHSEGGVVIRRLILDRYEKIDREVQEANPGVDANSLMKLKEVTLNKDFLFACDLRLFAPACMGINFSSWIGFLMTFSLLARATVASSVVKGELDPGSPVLRQLERGIERAHEEFPQIRCLFTRPLFGVFDQVVFSESYKGEEPYWDHSDHVDVCKPSYLRIRPLEFVVDGR